MATTASRLPNISQEDLANFYTSHFANTSTTHFSTTFLGPVEEEYKEEIEEDDGLGYYNDGVKRTLTDAQIAIFRHSEIQTLLRERRHAEEAMDDGLIEQPSKPTEVQEQFEEGELGDDNTKESSSAASSVANGQLSRKGRKAQQAKQKGYFKQKIKPDLRKRTWDKVDTGMGSLDYDDQSASAAAMKPPPQRRRITYDD